MGSMGSDFGIESVADKECQFLTSANRAVMAHSENFSITLQADTDQLVEHFLNLTSSSRESGIAASAH